MKIIIDLQGLQREGHRKRGIGRYCLEFTKNLIYNYPENEYILFTNSALTDLRKYFLEELKNKNLMVRYFKCPILGDMNGTFVGKFSKNWISIQLRSYALSIINADILLITSFFDGFRDNTLVSHSKIFNLPPIVSILYDLIPLIKCDEYLNNDPEFKLFYFQKIKELSNLDGLLAISESSRREAAKYLDINAESIYNISSACNKKLFSSKSSDLKIDKNSLGDFLLYSGATDPRKNLRRLIEAYALLPINLICKHKLVLTGPYTDEEIILIKEWMFNYGLPPEYVIFLGFVKDIELVSLYRNCYLFVFPSLHEGFGLPVLEAMNCGAPVIASNLTSLPEIIGDHEFLFDPYDAQDISSLISKCLTDDKFYQVICSNSRDREKYFTWEKTTKTTMESLNKVISKKSKFIKEEYFHDLLESQYKILINSLVQSPLVNSINKPNSVYLKSLSSAIDIINNQSKKIQISRQITDRKKFTWHIEGPFDSSYSLAILNRNFALAMDQLGEDVSLFSADGPGDYDPDAKFLDDNPIINKLYQKSIRSRERFFICTRNLYPPRVNDVNAAINLLHAYGWEESEFPQQWVQDFNSNLQGITVMSNLVKKILIDNGVQIPICVSGLGLNHIEQIEPDLNFVVTAKKYKILHVSSCFPRKGIDILLKAFSNLFTAKDDVTLIIKTFDNPHNEVESLIKSISKDCLSFPDVLVIKSDLSDAEMKALYLQSDLLVAPSRGEGFGLPIGEAMSLGLPVITTNWGGQVDFCNTSNSWIIDFEYAPSQSHFKSKYSYWAEPSETHLTELIHQVYNSDPIDIQKKIDCAKETTIKFTWSNVAKTNIDFIKTRILKNQNKYTKIGWVSTYNRRCGIASYSKYLLKNISEEITLFTSLNEQESISPGVNKLPSWKVEDFNDDLTNLYENIIKEDITSLILQLNYGFFNFRHLKDLLFQLQLKGIKLHIFLHSTIDPLNQNHQKLIYLKSSLVKCSRIYVHTLNDLNRLKDIGLIKNVSIFPHGFIDQEPKETSFIHRYWNQLISGKSFNIATYGFCLPNKGFQELIYAMNILHKKGLNFRLRLYSSIYNENYRWFYYELLELIKDLGLEHKINIDTTYQNDIKTLNNLAYQDCLIFPYQKTNESSSAAVRHGIASYCDVLVTPSQIFDDVSDLVEYLPGFSANDIAAGLISWYESNKYLTTREKIKRRKAKKLLLSNWRFSKLSERLISLIKSNEIN